MVEVSRVLGWAKNRVDRGRYMGENRKKEKKKEDTSANMIAQILSLES